MKIILHKDRIHVGIEMQYPTKRGVRKVTAWVSEEEATTLGHRLMSYGAGGGHTSEVVVEDD